MNFNTSLDSRRKKVVRSAAAAALAMSAFSPASAQRLGIIGGNPARAGDPIASSTVLIVGMLPPATAGGKPQQYICTGSLLAPDTLVTAAHCVAEDLKNPVLAANLRLVFGLAVTPTTTTLPPMRTPSGYLYEPGWQGAVNGAESGEDTHDIAVIHFDGGLPSGYAPATLLPASVPIDAGAEVTLAGYGVNDGVNDTGAGTLRIVNNVPVLQTLGETEVAMDQSGGVGSCSGDSGGPAFLNVDGKNLLWGVTSRGDKTCAQFGIYTRITAYADFVNGAEESLRSQDSTLQVANAKSESGLARQRLAAAQALGVAPKANVFAE
jgi:hypothetical protein